MWNKKRLDRLEKRVKWLENESHVLVPTKVHNLDIYPNGRQYDKVVSVPEALCIVIDYLHLTLHEKPENATITGIFDEKESEDING